MAILADPNNNLPKRATREALGETLLELAHEGAPVVAVDADLSGSTTMGKLGADPEFADRLVNVGIAEQNMIDVAAGLACTGKIAFTGSFAVFGTGRAYDQIRNTVAYSNLDVKICPTHAGVSVGPDGGSHQMLEDVALMRALPGMRVLVPSDYESAKAALRTAAATPGPVYVRLGREKLPQVYAEGVQTKLGGANVVREGADVTIVACGVELAFALQAAEALAEQGIDAEVIDAYSVKPLDEATILASIEKTGCAVVCEEHSVNGGLCDAVASVLAQNLPAPLEFVAMRDKFGKSASFAELAKHFRLDADSVVAAAAKVVARCR
jgi:transketolase